MKTRCGHPRKLSDRQIREVMKWHQQAIEFRRAHGTQRDLARLLGVSLHAVRGCFDSQIPHTSKSRVRRGRPRHLDADQIAFVLAWRRVAWQFQARYGSVPGLARKLGVGASTIYDCVRRKGRYIQFAYVDGYQAHISRRGHPSLSDNAVRARLLRAWRSPYLKSSRAAVKR
jgi:transposase